jgi:hypothetical protein
MIRIKGRAAIYGEVWYDEKPSHDCAAEIPLVSRQTRWRVTSKTVIA